MRLTATRHLPWLLAAGLPCLADAGAPREAWPIAFIQVSVHSSGAKETDLDSPLFDCQPELFDPQTTRYHLVKRNGTPSEMYVLDGGDDESVTMMIDGWDKQGEDKTVLPEPYALTKYTFGCASEFSQVFEFKKNGARHALYTHISQAQFSPDRKKLVLFNHLKSSKGGWQKARRVIEIETKRCGALPVIDETSFLACVGDESIVTYGMPAGSTSEQRTPRRNVCIWSLDGKLIRALSAPLRTTHSNGEHSDDGIGLLPHEPTTFYHLARTGENRCTLRLQDIRQASGRRSIQLEVPGSAVDHAEVGMRVQMDLEALTLKGGTMRYRVSPSGRGDVSEDWGAWKTAK